jgi:hypothetical protein
MESPGLHKATADLWNELSSTEKDSSLITRCRQKRIERIGKMNLAIDDVVGSIVNIINCD